jgi:hypothetical protein
LEVAELEETTEDLIRLYVAPRLGAMQVARIDVELLERLYARPWDDGAGRRRARYDLPTRRLRRRRRAFGP